MCAANDDEGKMVANCTTLLSHDLSAVQTGILSAGFGANTRTAIPTIETEQFHHARASGTDAEQFGCVGCPVPNFVGVDRLVVDLRGKLI